MTRRLAAWVLIISSALSSACTAGAAIPSNDIAWPSPAVDPVPVALARSISTRSPRVLEVRSGTFGSLFSGPGDSFRGMSEAERGLRLARPAWLVVLVGTYDAGCPLEPPTCAPVEWREELLIDAEDGAILGSSVVAPARGGIIPAPVDMPCGSVECGP